MKYTDNRHNTNHTKINKCLRIQIIMYLIVFLIWFFGFMPRVGFENYIKKFQIPLTMVFGGFVSGFTACGGGAVAFPVFCKVLHLDPLMARDFSLGIQSFGMTTASITILAKRIPIEPTITTLCSIGSCIGLLIGNLFVVPIVESSIMKLLFSILVAAFAVSLFLKNYCLGSESRKIHDRLQVKSKATYIVLFMIGFAGGIFTSLLGTGADIIVFSVATILFSMNEKILTPSSVVIMAVTSLAGLLMRTFLFGGIRADAASNFPLAIPIVVIFAPLGAVMASKINRKLVVNFLLTFIAIDVFTTFRTLHLSNVEKIVTISVFSMILFFYLVLLRISKRMDSGN